MSPKKAPALNDPQLYSSRELSQLDFNFRVLAQAQDASVPALERLRFLCISCTNLDEFFEIRGGSVRHAIEFGLPPSADGLAPGTLLNRIHDRAADLVDAQYRCFYEELRPALWDEGIRLLQREQWTDEQTAWLRSHFREEIMPVLSPLALDPAHPFPKILNKSLNVVVLLEGRDAFGREGHMAIVRAPRSLPRIIRLPDADGDGDAHHDFVFLSSLLSAFVDELFPGMTVLGAHQFRVTRNSELIVDEDDVDNLALALRDELIGRGYLRAVRLEIDERCPQDIVDSLLANFELPANAVYKISGPVNLNRIIQLYDLIAQPDLKYPPMTPRTLRDSDGIFETAAVLRNGLSDVTASLPAPASGLVAGLAVGDTSNVTAELDTRMQDASLSHLTAVSGANCALVVAIAFFAAAACGFGRRMRVVLALCALSGFVVLVTPEPSVVRAAAMSAIAMLGILLGRVGAGVSLLSTAIIGALVLDPWLALSLGFALSASATAALLLLAGPLAAGLERWLPAPLAIALSVPVAAQLACGPLLVLLTPSIPVYGVIANLLAAPAAPIATIVGLAACLLAGVPLLGAGLATLAWVPAAWITGVANVFATLPGALLPWWSGPVGLLALLVAGGAVAGVLMGRARRASATVLALLCAVLIAMGPVSRMLDRTRVPASWSIAACAVGQGDALLIRSAEHIALVDTGPDEASLRRCLDRFGIEKIDLLVLTHFDLDHAGGAATVIGDVAAVLHGPVADPDDDALLAAFESAGAALHAVKPGTSGPLGDATWRTLWPSADTPPGNDASVVIEVSGGGLPRTLFLGDLAARPQARVAGALSGTYDVVKVAHHGSADQYPPLYTSVQPRLALVTVGENTYGHPRDEILEVLEAAGASIARTDTEGDIAVWTDGGALHVWRSRPLPGVGADEDVDAGVVGCGDRLEAPFVQLQHVPVVVGELLPGRLGDPGEGLDVDQGRHDRDLPLGEERDAIEDIYEPFLMQVGFLERTPAGGS